MAELLVDTDIFIDHLRGHRAFSPGKNRIFYSVITRAELFAGRNVDEEAIGTLLAPFTEVAVDRSIAERSGRLRRTASISLPDAISASTALHRELVLMTRNTKDFELIEGLKLRAGAARGRA